MELKSENRDNFLISRFIVHLLEDMFFSTTVLVENVSRDQLRVPEMRN